MFRFAFIVIISTVLAPVVYIPQPKAAPITKTVSSSSYAGTDFSLKGFFVRTSPVNDEGSEESVRITIDPSRNEVSVDFLFNNFALDRFQDFYSITLFVFDPMFLSTSDVTSIRHGVYTTQAPSLSLPDSGLPIIEGLGESPLETNEATVQHYLSDTGRQKKSNVSVKADLEGITTNADRYNDFGFENTDLDPQTYSIYSYYDERQSGIDSPYPSKTYDFFEGISALSLPVRFNDGHQIKVNTLMTRTVFTFNRNVLVRNIPLPQTIFLFLFGAIVIALASRAKVPKRSTVKNEVSAH